MKTLKLLLAFALLPLAALAQTEPLVNSYTIIPNAVQFNWASTPNSVGAIQGLVTLNDGQGGLFAYSPSSVTATNTTNCFAVSGLPGRLIRLTGGQFSLTGDGTIMSNNLQTVSAPGGAFSLSLIPQSAKTFLAGPLTGAAAAPTFITAANAKLVLGVQAGTTTTAADGTVTNTFGTAFSTAPVVTTTPVNSSTPTNTVVSVTSSNFVAKLGTQSVVLNWIAVGAP